ncbi:MAG: DUF1730 domain-containing protein [Clostridiales bacterium]|nr:DUF1730 domain-containing protein [Clostridiales bacterium]
MLKTIELLYKESGAVSFGILPFALLEESMTERMKNKKNRLCPWAETVISVAFAYEKDATGNLAAFSRGRDYHLVIKERLNEISKKLKEIYPNNRFLSFADDAPFLEVLAAVFSGAGALGKNGLVLVKPYGNHILLGEIVTDVFVNHAGSKNIKTCLDCSRCVAACPTGAMTYKDSRRILDRSMCISAITQKKGDLTDKEIEYLKMGNSIWGCDLCINACPENKGSTPNPIFGRKDERICSFDVKSLQELADDDFLRLYFGRSFTYRGIKPLIRNLRIKNSISLNNQTPEQE